MDKDDRWLDLKAIIYNRYRINYTKGMFRLLTNLREIQKETKGWLFDWKKELDKGHSIYALTLESRAIQGLIALKLDDNFVEVSLVEVAPHNFGLKRRYDLVGPSLFAFAAMISFYAGFEGYLCFTAKSSLVNHYEKRYYADHINSLRMYINTEGASKLVREVFGQEVLKDGNWE